MVIENFRAVVKGKIGVRKELFFGPNGGGKSSIIRTVGLFYRGGAIYPEDVRWRPTGL
ncbi:ATP-binding protein [Thermoproteus tenax]|uniref:ATP-binding protein n=1 Tax=Thermoproteus tenax TaxID=2271 RepID=UPI001433105F|nr:ATP-binding protein [Thermoproteus tenax]